MSLSRWVLMGAAIAVCGVVVAVFLAPGGERETTAPAPRLRLDVTLDKAVYGRAEPVTATVQVENQGRVASGALTVDCAEKPVSMPLPLGDGSARLPLDSDIDFGVIEPSLSATRTIHGVVSQEAYDNGTVVVVCTMLVGRTRHEAQFDAGVTGASNAVTGRFTVCTKDGTSPAAAGVRLTLDRVPGSAAAPPVGPWSTTTDANGTFTIPAVPAGLYQLAYDPPAGYVANSIPGQGGRLQVLVTTDRLWWQASSLTVTTTDPATACDDPI